MVRNDFQQTMQEIVAALKGAGYDPYDQLTGYLQTGEDFYITRQGGAREKIVQLDKAQIRAYLDTVRKT